MRGILVAKTQAKEETSPMTQKALPGWIGSDPDIALRSPHNPISSEGTFDGGRRHRASYGPLRAAPGHHVILHLRLGFSRAEVGHFHVEPKRPRIPISTPARFFEAFIADITAANHDPSADIPAVFARHGVELL